MYQGKNTKLNSFHCCHVRCHTFRFSCSKPAPLSRWTTVVYNEWQETEVFEGAGGTPEDFSWHSGIISAADRKSLDKLIRRALSWDVPLTTWRRKRTKLPSVLVNDNHSDNTGELRQCRATSTTCVKEVLPFCRRQHRSSYTTDSQHLTKCTIYTI